MLNGGSSLSWHLLRLLPTTRNYFIVNISQQQVSPKTYSFAKLIGKFTEGTTMNKYYY